MDILESVLEDISIVSLRGRLDTSCAGDLEKKLDSLINSAQVRMVVNLKEVEYISSSGLRVFLAELKKVRKQGGDIKLACLKPEIRQVFDIAGFTQLFNIFDTMELAMAHYKESR